MNSLEDALFLVFAMGAVILFCRLFPFLFFRVNETKEGTVSGRKAALLDFVEKTVPPVAMTVLAFNIMGSSFRDNIQDGFLVLAACVCTALLHLLKRNSLLSIFGGTALYMLLHNIILQGK